MLHHLQPAYFTKTAKTFYLGFTCTTIVSLGINKLLLINYIIFAIDTNVCGTTIDFMNSQIAVILKYSRSQQYDCPPFNSDFYGCALFAVVSSSLVFHSSQLPVFILHSNLCK